MSEELREKDKAVPGRGSRNFKYFGWNGWRRGCQKIKLKR